MQLSLSCWFVTLLAPSETTRVFLSYARIDGAALARRLQKDLTDQGFAAWLDKQRIAGGAVWTDVIESALDQAEYVVALLTQGSYVSEICRAEQLRALRKSKCVIPVMAQSGADVPLHLEAKNYRDFTIEARYPQAFAELLSDLHARNGIELKPEFRKTKYNTVPPLPVNFVARPESLAALRDALITDGLSSQIAVTSLKGMGGIGKTVLAQALCHDDVVQQAFPDGIIWVAVGKEASMDLARLREVGKAIGDDLSCYDSDLAARNQYRNTIRDKAALIVVDDVWKASDLEPLRAEDSPRSRLLFTTRDASIGRFAGAREHSAGLMNAAHSRQLLASWAGLQPSELPAAAEELVSACGNLPLALPVVGGMLRGASHKSWQDTLCLLRNSDLSAIEEQLPEGQQSFFRAVEVSFQSLKLEMQERYKALAVLLEDMAAPLPILQTLWNVDEPEARRISRILADRSLAQRDNADESIRLHDLQLDYVRAQFPDRQALDLVHGAIRLSAHVITKDPDQFASQMVGRLLPHYDLAAIKEFAERTSRGASKPWLRPFQASLHPPGTSLVRTLQGHTNWVNDVALSGDGLLAVSASSDRTLKVWEVETGRELRTLQGDTRAINGVALSGDGKSAVSASEDNTLKVWDVMTGCELRTLQGHTNWVNGVALSGDGRHAVSASLDHTLKVWEVETGRELRTLQGHLKAVYGVALSGDGRRAVSASEDETLKVWDVETGQEFRTLRGHTSAVNGVAVSKDGRHAVSASYDQTLKVWDLETGRELRSFRGHTGSVYSVALSGDGRHAVSASYDQTLKVWDVETGRELRSFRGHTGSANGVALSGDCRCAVSASDDQTLKVWNVETERELRIFQRHKSRVLGVALSGDGRHAVSASSDRTVKVWDVETGYELRTLQGHTNTVSGVALSEDGGNAVSASWDQTLKVWDVDAGQELRTLQGHTKPVIGVALSGDGRRAVSASEDKTLKVWDVETGSELRTLHGHTDRVYGVALARDSRRAFSASRDRTLKVWDVETGEVIGTFTCDGAPHCCGFIEDDLFIAGDEGGHVHFLRLEEPKNED